MLKAVITTYRWVGRFFISPHFININAKSILKDERISPNMVKDSSYSFTYQSYFLTHFQINSFLLHICIAKLFPSYAFA